jgi:hypothetical protein
LSESEHQSAEVIADDLLTQAFPDLWGWERPTLNEAIGPNNLDDVEAFERKRTSFMAAAKQALASKSEDDIAAARQDEADLIRGARSIIRDLLGDDIMRTMPRIPPPLAYGFGHPSFATDFIYWSQMSELRLHEAVMVSVGVDPEAIDEDRVRKWEKERDKAGREAGYFRAVEFLLRRRKLMYRAFPSWIEGPTPANTKRLYEWMRSVELELQPGFAAALARRFADKPKPTSPETSAKALSAQERSTLLKLIAAMACEQYGYDPRGDRSDVAPNIQKDLELVGLTMDAKTIRKWLREAAQQVEASYWDNSF